MLKMKVVMDEEKIKQNNEYTVPDIQNHLKKCFEKYNFKQVEENTFGGNDNEDDGTFFMALIGIFQKCEWFMDYVKEWVWIDEEEDYIEDLLA